MIKQWYKIFLSLMLFFALASVVSAQGYESSVKAPTLAVSIGGQTQLLSGIGPCQGDSSKLCVNWLAEYVSIIYRYGVSVTVILAVVSVMIGGFLWLVSAGSPDKVGRAKEFITAAIFGLVIALFSYLILQTVNPRLIDPPQLELLGIKAPELAAPTTNNWVDTDSGFYQSEGYVWRQSCDGVLQQQVDDSLCHGTKPAGAVCCKETDIKGIAPAEVGGSNDTIDITPPPIPNPFTNFRQTSTINGTHSPGSCHYIGLAADFAWTNIQTDSAGRQLFSSAASQCGLKVIDEVTNPSAASSGPHMHVAACGCIGSSSNNRLPSFSCTLHYNAQTPINQNRPSSMHPQLQQGISCLRAKLGT